MSVTRGVCVWLTGRSGVGKTTVTTELVRFIEETGRVVTVLDVVPELEKQKGEPTSEGKLLRKAFVSREVVRHGGIAVCVTISSRADVRERARNLVGSDGFVEVFVDAPARLSAQRRSSRGSRRPPLKAARRWLGGLKRRLAGGPPPSGNRRESADLVIDTSATEPAANAAIIFRFLEERGHLATGESVAAVGESGDASTLGLAD